MTKTQQLRAALEKLGFKKIETRSQRGCLRGFTVHGRDVYVYLNDVGGGRYSFDVPRASGSLAIKDKSIALVLAGQPSNLLHHG